MFNSHALCEIISGGDEEIIKWCQKAGLLRRQRTCDVCGSETRIYHRRSGTGHSRWRCIKGGGSGQPHSWEESVTKDTIFEGTKFGIGRILRLFYYFAHGFTKYSDLIRETSTRDETTSESTVCQWLTYCRKVCTKWMESKFEEDKIGGPGTTVQIGETTIGKRKSSSNHVEVVVATATATDGGIESNANKRRVTHDQWVIGMIESISNRTNLHTITKSSVAAVVNHEATSINDDSNSVNNNNKTGRFRVEVLPVRDESTLACLIKKHVQPGTTIMTDCQCGKWNSGELVPVDQRQWQTIQNLWKSLKVEVRRGGNRGINDNLTDHLCEMMWRREMDRLGWDRFLGFVQCAVEVYNSY